MYLIRQGNPYFLEESHFVTVTTEEIIIPRLAESQKVFHEVNPKKSQVKNY